jgi:hypothetical protein
MPQRGIGRRRSAPFGATKPSLGPSGLRAVCDRLGGQNQPASPRARTAGARIRRPRCPVNRTGQPGPGPTGRAKRWPLATGTPMPARGGFPLPRCGGVPLDGPCAHVGHPLNSGRRKIFSGLALRAWRQTAALRPLAVRGLRFSAHKTAARSRRPQAANLAAGTVNI